MGRRSTPLGQPSNIVVVLSRDVALVEGLPEGLAARDPSIEVQVCRSVDGLQQHIRRLEPDALVLDLASLPDAGAAMLDARLLKRVPTVVLAGTDRQGEECRDSALRAGAAVVVPLGGRYVADVSDAVLSQRRTSPAQIAEAVQHYRDILDASADGIFVLIDGAFHYVNRAFADLVGAQPATLVSQARFLTLLAPEDRNRIAEIVSHVGVGGHHDRLIETRLLGASLPVQVQMTLRASVIDGRRAVVGVARDIGGVEALLHEVEQTRQRVAKIERLRALGELSAGVAHDFNNALGTIIGRITLARDKLGKGKPILDDLAVIDSAARNAASIVKRIQDFARPAAHEVWEDVDLGQVASDSAEYIRASLPPNIQLRVDVEKTPLVRGNGVELREVLLNLLRNAADALGTTGNIHISCLAKADSVVVEVEDDGPGMSDEVKSRIFEPFFTTKGDRGTGLGLSVSHWILRRHDALIDLDSTPGKGTCFRLSFMPAAAVQHRQPQHALSAPRVLIVDDDPAVADMIREHLIELGHEVEVVGSIAAAMRHVAERVPDAVITDLDLPDGSGWLLARRIREQHPAARVALMTGWRLTISADELRARGVDLALQKPFPLDELRALLPTA